MKNILAVFVAFAACFAFPSPANASTYLTTQIGTSYAGQDVPSSATGPAILYASDPTKCQIASYTVVVRDGDYIYVSDSCADGKSALGQVQFSFEGNNYIRRCRNASGVGTFRRCNFDWPESPVKSLYAATKAYPDGAVTIGVPGVFND